MSINLLDMLKDQVTGSLAKQASGFLGESESNVTNALGGVFPALLGSVIGQSEKPSGASGLMDMIGGLDTGMLGDIGGLFGGGASSVNGLLNSGGGIVESLLGNKMGGMVDMISKMSGLKSGSSSSLLKMAAPFLIGMIGKQMKGKGLSFLTDMLSGQKSHVSSALPSGMGSLLGLGFADKVTGAVTNAASSAANTITSGASKVTDAAGNVANVAGDAAKSGLGWIKWALPALLIAGLAYMMWPGAKDSMDKVANTAKSAASSTVDGAKNMANKAADATKDMANAAGDMAKAAFAKVDATAKAALDKVKFQANSAGSQMMDYIDGGFKGDGKVTFRNLTFATGSAKISGTSAVEVDNLASILKAYPGVNINVNGYTDNKGDAAGNVRLSQARAQAVKARLMGKGIAANRVSTKGYGADSPVASNDTDKGRAMNRRIEVTIGK